MRFTRWDQVSSEKDTHETVSKLVSWHQAQIKSDAARGSLLGLLSAGPLAICKFDIDYTAVDAHDASHIRQCLAFYQKRCDIELGIDRREVALRSFRRSEQICSESNDIFKLWASGRFSFSPDIEAVFYRAQCIIASILGDVPKFETLNFGFGPGATTQIKRKISSARSKLSKKFCCSEDLVPIVSTLLAEMPGWVPHNDSDHALVDIEIHPCRLSFVPKNAKTDRGICTEPSLNVMFQRGVGQYMTRRLLHFGVDLLDQTKNKRLAREGSLSGALATLDLSMASDLISTEVVYHLLPIDWAAFLNYGRSSSCEVEGSVQKLQKFSSMGNGFTFPLESLIFFGLAKACSERNEVVSVYGDDIIVSTRAVPLLRKALHAAGFVVNEDKSYSSGPFRESCGGDYYSGADIRPFYLRDKMSGQAAFLLHNFYVRKGMLEPAAIVLETIAEPLRIWGPDGYGDGHLLGDFSPRPHGREKGWAGYTFDTYTLCPLKDFQVREGDHVLPCYSIYAGGPEFGLGIAKFLDPWGERPAAFPSYRAQSAFYRRGVLGVSIPGYKGYKRVTIYALA